MKKIYLFCSAGMSTSMLASRMQKAADDHQLPIEVLAFPDGKIAQIVEEKHPDVILLGPQIKFRFEEVSAKYSTMGIPVEVIDQAAYGMMDGEKVLKSAILLIKKAKSV